ncbi:peptidase C39 family protein [Microbacterium sp. GXF0217]
MPRVAVFPYDPEALPAVPIPREVADRWLSADRSSRSPEILAAIDEDGAAVGFALITARSGCAYLKIVDAVGDVRAVLDVAAQLARSRGLVQLKWEGWTATPQDAETAGFAVLTAPSENRVEDGEPERGYVRWLVDAEVTEPQYYRQTETFTCGAVVALMAQAIAGRVDSSDLNRAAELSLWRAATNFPSCDPVGLAVAVRNRWPEEYVGVALDVDRPLMIGHLSSSEQQWRAELQRVSRAEAAALELDVSAERMPLSAVRATVAARRSALLLLSLDLMQGFDVPHWVLCHGEVPGALVIEDPWTGPGTGDTWVDAHLLPVADRSLDAMAAIEEDRCRAVVVVG